MSSHLTNSLVFGVMAVLSGGYIIYESTICRLIWSRHTGYILYLRTITAGLLLYGITLITVEWVKDFWPSLLALLDFDPLVPVLPLLFAIVLWLFSEGVIWGCGLFGPKLKNYIQLRNLRDLGFDQFICERIIKSKMVMITLKNGKVYIGLPLETPYNENEKWLRLMPFWSGHRDEELNLLLDVNYSKVFGNTPFGSNRMLIPVQEIVTAQPFDLEIYKKFQSDSR